MRVLLQQFGRKDNMAKEKIKLNIKFYLEPKSTCKLQFAPADSSNSTHDFAPLANAT